ncbi:MAG: hypothetical protein ABUL62_11280 [Myxococcales bacterium]
MRSAPWVGVALPLAFGVCALGLATHGHGAEPTNGVAPSPAAVLDAGSDAPAAPTHPPVTPPPYALVDAGWDRPIRVLPSAEPSRRVLVYLHGYCGDVNAVGAFVPAAAAHGTLIALLGDQPCPKDKPGRFKWSTDAHALDQRIQRAIRLVNRAQKLDLDAHDITLFGYSQGAVRAESLARYYAQRYPRVILGGPPRRPKPEHFKHVRRIAVLGGELEDTTDMLGGADDLIAAGFQARFFLLPGVDHGDFGGELAGNRALSEIFAFVSDTGPLVAPAPEPQIAR